MNEMSVIDKGNILKWMMEMVSKDHYKLFKPSINYFLEKEKMDPNTTPDKIPAQQWIGLHNKVGSINLYLVDDKENNHEKYREFYNVLCREFEKVNNVCWNSGGKVTITLNSPSENFHINITCESVTPKSKEGKFLFYFDINPNVAFIERTKYEYWFRFYFNGLLWHSATFSFSMSKDPRNYTLIDVYEEFGKFMWFMQNF